MKKLFTFFALLFIFLFFGINETKAQLTEDFEAQTSLTTSYADGSFTNATTGITWTYGHSRDEGDYSITLKGFMLRRASDSYLEATFPNGVGSFNFQYRKAFTGASPRQLELLVNGTQVTTTAEFGGVSGADETIYDFAFAVNTAGSVTIRIKNVGTTTTNRQAVLDNISWTEFGGSNPTITVTSPSSGANWQQGTSQNITWTSANISANVKIEYSNNASNATPTWSVLAASVAASAGTWTWNIPASQALSTDSKIRITDIPQTATATSGTFNITAPTPILTSIAALRASATGNEYILSSEAIISFFQSYRHQKYIQDVTAGILIDDNSGTITTTYAIGDGITGIKGTLNEFGGMMQFTPVQNTGAASSTGNVLTPVNVTIPTLTSNFENYESELVKLENVTFTNPTGNFANGQVYEIKDASNNTYNFRTTFYDVDYIGTPIPTTPLSMVAIPNSRNDGNYITSRSLEDFIISTSSITVTSPNGGEFIQQGTTHNITWLSSNINGNVKIELIGTNAGIIAASVENNGSYTWNVPANQAIANDYKIKISDVNTGTIIDESNEVFSVIAPIVIPNLVITEIMYNSPGQDEEWIEIYNNDSYAVNMENYWLIDNVATHNKIVLPAGASINPGDRYTVKVATAGAFPFVPDFDGSGIFGLNNSNDEVKLYNNYDMLVDSVYYGSTSPWPTQANGNGSSLTFCDPSLDNGIPDFWTASTEILNDSIYATPGSGCYISSNDIIITEIMYNPPDMGNDTIEFIEIYNKGLSPVNLKDWTISPSVNYTFPDTTIQPNSYYVIANYPIPMLYTFGITCAQWDQTYLNNIGDVVILSDAIGAEKDRVEYTNQAPWPVIPLVDGGPSLTFCDYSLDNGLPENWSLSSNIAAYNNAGVPIYASPGEGCKSGANIMITEIMYNPPESGVDSLEFIEIYNLGNSINLEGFKFDAGVTFTFPDVVIDSAGYILVAINSNAIQNVFGVNSLQWETGALSNSGETIKIVDNYGILLDEVTYSNSAPWDSLANGKGHSLTFCDPSLDNSIPSNWAASLDFAAINSVGDSIYATPLGTCINPPPVANFTASQTVIIVGNTVTFTDLSTNNPISWEWTFEGGTPETSTEQNPTVAYNSVGQYDVTLKVTNIHGSAILTIPDMITVGIDNVSSFENNIKIYPNPTTGLVKISNPDGTQKQITLINISGKEISKTIDNNTLININYSLVPKGLYFLKIENLEDKTSKVVKLIIH